MTAFNDDLSIRLDKRIAKRGECRLLTAKQSRNIKLQVKQVKQELAIISAKVSQKIALSSEEQSRLRSGTVDMLLTRLEGIIKDYDDTCLILNKRLIKVLRDIKQLDIRINKGEIGSKDTTNAIEIRYKLQQTCNDLLLRRMDNHKSLAMTLKPLGVTTEPPATSSINSPSSNFLQIFFDGKEGEKVKEAAMEKLKRIEGYLEVTPENEKKND